uniref:hypothetical protein n=1 Tax=Bradyrhizobium sp. (strain ORS 278) TaxID=114615 RepID=UPI0012FEBC61|nr:hypothetical protein [Bradyrhizobium sp. ORS 278]
MPNAQFADGFQSLNAVIEINRRNIFVVFQLVRWSFLPSTGQILPHANEAGSDGGFKMAAGRHGGVHSRRRIRLKTQLQRLLTTPRDQNYDEWAARLSSQKTARQARKSLGNFFRITPTKLSYFPDLSVLAGEVFPFSRRFFRLCAPDTASSYVRVDSSGQMRCERRDMSGASINRACFAMFQTGNSVDKAPVRAITDFVVDDRKKMLIRVV